jgi:hypothetical protein
VDGGDEVLGLGALEQETGGAGVQRTEDVIVVLEGRQDQDACLGVRCRYSAKPTTWALSEACSATAF